MSAHAARTARSVPALCLSIPSAGSSITQPELESTSDSIETTSSAFRCCSFCLLCSPPSSFSFVFANATVDGGAQIIVTVGVGAAVSAVFGGLLAFAKAFSCRVRF